MVTPIGALPHQVSITEVRRVEQGELLIHPITEEIQIQI